MVEGSPKVVKPKGAAITIKRAEELATGKQPRDDNGGLAKLDKRRRGLETFIHDVMGGTVLPPFDLDPSSKLPLGME
ncbi:unnamed protein product, partial [Prunus brigantina]